MSSNVKICMRLLCVLLFIGVIVQYGSCEPEPRMQSMIAGNTDEIYDEPEVAEKRGGGRPFSEVDADKRGGARSFQVKRGGARAFLPQNWKRAGGRGFRFHGGNDYNLGSSLYAPNYYEKKASYLPYYLTEFKRGGGRAFMPEHSWYVGANMSEEKRAGGRTFPVFPDESKEKLVNELHG